MKKRSMFLAIAGVFFCSSTSVLAGYNAVANTPHNLSNAGAGGGSGAFRADYEAQICKFCHTPHNANESRGLWNHPLPDTSGGNTFRMYTSSPTLSTAAKNVSAPSSESLFCLACHDGKTAVNVVHTSAPGTGVNTYGASSTGEPVLSMGGNGFNADGTIALGNIWGSDFMFGTGLGTGPNLGGLPANESGVSPDPTFGRDLTNDHPISFSYTAAQGQKGATHLNASPESAQDSNGFAVKFFGGAEKRLECGSCHEPHRDQLTYPQYKKFLIRDNSGSGLCLACHNK